MQEILFPDGPGQEAVLALFIVGLQFRTKAKSWVLVRPEEAVTYYGILTDQ